MGNSIPLPQEPPSRSTPKFDNYIGDPDPYAKFHAPQVCENAHQVTQLVFWFFLPPTAKTPTPIFTPNTSNDVFSCKDVPFGGLKYKILYFDPIFPQKKRKFWANFRRDGKFRLKKDLTMGMITCKLPLIIIVAPRNLYRSFCDICCFRSASWRMSSLKGVANC